MLQHCSVIHATCDLKQSLANLIEVRYPPYFIDDVAAARRQVSHTLQTVPKPATFMPEIVKLVDTKPPRRHGESKERAVRSFRT